MRSSKFKTSEPIYDVTMEFNVKQEMRDGVKLSADIYRPDSEGRFPVILVRTCYSSAYSLWAEHLQEVLGYAKFFAQHGYVFVVQDVRGKNDSEGDWYPVINEAKDGFDTQEWCGTREWANGRVGTYGFSYLTWTQMLPAPLRNPHLKTMVWLGAPNDPFSNLPYRGGAFNLAIVAWAALMDGRKNQSLCPYEDMQALYKHRPIIDLDQAFGRKIPWWSDWVQHSTYDSYWKTLSFEDKYSEIDVPILHISGWYDDSGIGIGTRDNFVGMVTHGRSEPTRKNQKLIVGPWLHHEFGRANKIGVIDFGPYAIIDLKTTLLRWFDYWLKGIDTGIMEESPVQLFVMGENRWREENEWPLARTQFTNFYLHSFGRANSLLGDGVLSTKLPGNEPPDTYTYDPDDPVPIAEPYPFQLGGPANQQITERRDDVLVYRTPPLKQELEVTGPLFVKLYAATDVKDTDFTATLVDVLPSGFVKWLNDGIIRARYRDSFEQPTLLEPGKIYEYTIDLMWTSNLFKKGHRIGLEIASARFPAAGPNPNTGRDIGTGTQTICAHQTICHDREHSSYIILPVIPRP